MTIKSSAAVVLNVITPRISTYMPIAGADDQGYTNLNPPDMFMSSLSPLSRR